MAAGGDSQGKFQCRVQRIEDLSRDQALHFNPKKRLYVEVCFDGGLPPAVAAGAYLLNLGSFRANPRDEIRSLLSLTGMPRSSGSEEDLIDTIVGGILTATEGEENGSLDNIPLYVDITSTESRKVEEKVYNCPLCLKDIVDEEGEEPDCGHVFHQDCIFSWLQEDDTCPTCGYEIDMDR